MHYSVRGIIKIDDSVLLIHRIKLQPDGTLREYYVIPGGEIENGETELQALSREISEEIGIEVLIKDKVFTYNSEYDDSVQYFYECEYVTGEIGSGNGPEFQREMKEGELFRIELVKIKEVEEINLVPEEIKRIIKNDLAYISE